jgi:hypothetical protein
MRAGATPAVVDEALEAAAPFLDERERELAMALWERLRG